jgi:hypothetical protein
MSSLALWQYIQLWLRVREVVLTDTSDTLLWTWTADAQYSSKSCYEFLFHEAITSSYCKLNWRIWAPPQVKFFVWLTCLDRCWTGDRLSSRGVPHPPRCPLCDQTGETMQRVHPSELAVARLVGVSAFHGEAQQ